MDTVQNAKSNRSLSRICWCCQIQHLSSEQVRIKTNLARTGKSISYAMHFIRLASQSPLISGSETSWSDYLNSLRKTKWMTSYWLTHMTFCWWAEILFTEDNPNQCPVASPSDETQRWGCSECMTVERRSKVLLQRQLSGILYDRKHDTTTP